MELHTLGVDGGYTQDDVIAVARAFTGWTIYDPQRFAEYQFNPAFHDRKEKVILGHVIPAMGAEQDGLQVIDLLAHHPSTAAFISRKLAQRFVADDPPKSLVDRMAETFSQDRRRSASRSPDAVLVHRVPLGRRLAGQTEIAARDGRQRGAGCRRRRQRYVRPCPAHRRSRRAALWQGRTDRIPEYVGRLDQYRGRARPNQFRERPRVGPDSWREGRSRSVLRETGIGCRRGFAQRRALRIDAGGHRKECRGFSAASSSSLLPALVIGSPDFQRR